MTLNLNLTQKLMIAIGCECLALPFLLYVSPVGGNRMLFQFTCLTAACCLFVLADVQDDDV